MWTSPRSPPALTARHVPEHVWVATTRRIKDGISLDHLSRLLADVHVDSSRLVDAMLSRTQNEIIDLVFRGDGLNRNKVNLIVANEIVPHLTAEEYMDKGEYENELKQVLGETRAAFDISQYDTLIFGEHGMLLTGPNSRQYEPLLCAYLQFVSLDLFIRNFYNRLNILQDDVSEVCPYRHRGFLHRSCGWARGSLLTPCRCVDCWWSPAKTPSPTQKPRKSSCVSWRTSSCPTRCVCHAHTAACVYVSVSVSVWVAPQLVVRAVLQCLSFLTESLEDMGVPAAPSVQAGKNLYDRLALERTQVELARRVTDVNKFLVELKQMMEVAKHEEAEITTELRAQVQGVLVRNTRDALHIVRPLQMQQHTLVIMYVVHAVAILRVCEASVAHLVGGVLQHGDSPRLVGVRRA